jgi:hypothetical protein
MNINSCILCGRDSADVEFCDSITHKAYVECLYENCRHSGEVATGKTPEEAIEKAIELWNKEGSE